MLGQEVHVDFRHDAVSISLGLAADQQSHNQAAAALAANDELLAAGAGLLPLGSWCSPLRMWQLQDLAGRWRPLATAIKTHLTPLAFHSGSNSGSEVLDSARFAEAPEVMVLGDGVMLPLVAAAVCSSVDAETHSAPQQQRTAGWTVTVRCLQDTGVGLRWVQQAAAALQRSGCIGAVECLPTRALFRDLEMTSQAATTTSTDAAAAATAATSLSPLPAQDESQAPAAGMKATALPPLLVVGEPWYRELEGLLPWSNLRFWSQLQRIR